MSAVRYAWSEAWTSLRRDVRAALVSVLTIAVAFVTLGGFLVATVNLQSIAQTWGEAAEMSVYLEDTLDDAERTVLEGALRAEPDVAAVEYVSSHQALERFTAAFPELKDVAQPGERNPFPASFELRIRTDARSTERLQALAEMVAGRPGVADVQFDQRWITRVLAIVSTVRLVSVSVGMVLLIGAVFTAAAVVRLSLVARTKELEIMTLVGAPTAFVRGPFVMEGLLQGGVGALLALAALGLGYLLVMTNARELLSGVIGTDQLHFFGVRGLTLLLAAGLGVGALAGLLASRTAGEASPA